MILMNAIQTGKKTLKEKYMHVFVFTAMGIKLISQKYLRWNINRRLVINRTAHCTMIWKSGNLW